VGAGAPGKAVQEFEGGTVEGGNDLLIMPYTDMAGLGLTNTIGPKPTFV
jgi:hypothetical protein